MKNVCFLFLFIGVPIMGMESIQKLSLYTGKPITVTHFENNDPLKIRASVEEILKNGEDVNTSLDAMSVKIPLPCLFRIAGYDEYSDLVDQLIEKKARFTERYFHVWHGTYIPDKENILCHAARSTKNLPKFIMPYLANDETKEDIEKLIRGTSWSTPLHSAASWGNIGNMRLLLSLGAKADSCLFEDVCVPLKYFLQSLWLWLYDNPKSNNEIMEGAALLLLYGSPVGWRECTELETIKKTNLEQFEAIKKVLQKCICFHEKKQQQKLKRFVTGDILFRVNKTDLRIPENCLDEEIKIDDIKKTLESKLCLDNLSK